MANFFQGQSEIRRTVVLLAFVMALVLLVFFLGYVSGYNSAYYASEKEIMELMRKCILF
tara:strand:+ start:886 stop:1062 length:177 start_codon:yes stop_codon:yes gene_type:complete